MAPLIQAILCVQRQGAMFSSSPLWERLPDDLWHKILTHLGFRPHQPCRPLESVSLVCKRFLALSNRIVTFFSIKPTIKRVPLPTLFSRFPNITSICLIRDLDLDASITLLANSGLRLQSFDLTGQTHFPKEAMRLLGDRMSRTLKSLSCVSLEVFNDDDLAVVTGCFSYLEEFEIEGHLNMDVFVTDQGISEISTKLKSLVSINLLYQERRTHRSLDYLVSNCPSLRNIQFGCSYIRMDQLDRFDLFRSLSSLHLKWAEFSQRVLVQLSKVGLKLEKLKLDKPLITSDVTGEILCGFFKSCRSLRSLHLTLLTFPPDTNAIEFAASLPNIKDIRLWETTATIPPATLLFLLCKCPLLEEIHIACSFLGITQDWFKNSAAKYLVRKLDLIYCNDLCDETLKLLVSVCPKLEALCLMRCAKITQKGIEAVAASCNNIKLLYVEVSGNLRDFKLDRRDHVLEQ